MSTRDSKNTDTDTEDEWKSQTSELTERFDGWAPPSMLVRQAKSGTLALVGGGIFLARAAKLARRNRRRAFGQALLGGALLAIGLRQRRSGGFGEDGPTTGPATDEDTTKVDDEAHTAVSRPDEGPPSTDEPVGERVEPTDVESTGAPPEPGADITTDRGEDPIQPPDLDEESLDPGRAPSEGPDDEYEMADVSPADEPGEAVGPEPGQAEPTQTEDTEPEASPPEDSSHTQADVPGPGSDIDEGAEEDEDDEMAADTESDTSEAEPDDEASD